MARQWRERGELREVRNDIAARTPRIVAVIGIRAVAVLRHGPGRIHLAHAMARLRRHGDLAPDQGEQAQPDNEAATTMQEKSLAVRDKA